MLEKTLYTVTLIQNTVIKASGSPSLKAIYPGESKSQSVQATASMIASLARLCDFRFVPAPLWACFFLCSVRGIVKLTFEVSSYLSIKGRQASREGVTGFSLQIPPSSLVSQPTGQALPSTRMPLRGLGAEGDRSRTSQTGQGRLGSADRKGAKLYSGSPHLGWGRVHSGCQ